MPSRRLKRIRTQGTSMTWKPKHPSCLAGALGGLLCMQLAAAQTTTIDDLYEAGARRVAQAEQQQEQIDQIVDATEDLFDDYQAVLREIENLEVYNRLLQAQVDGQNADLQTLYESIDQVSFIERQVLPLMQRMIRVLGEFIQADMPFLVGERMARVDSLNQLLNQSNYTAAQQFRAVMDAWLTEMNDYGRFSEVYVDTIDVGGVSREVELLRVGRVALVYLTRDGTEAGFWDNENREWKPLDSSMAAEIKVGIDSAKEDIPPALFMVPVPPPVLGEDG